MLRKQLTLFVPKELSKNIEIVRSKFNPTQRKLIDSHVTLCREDEIEDLEKVLQNLATLNHKRITLKFGNVKRIENGNGVILPALSETKEFNELRRKILNEIMENPRATNPHVTLMHPRNSICDDFIFREIKKVKLPKQLRFYAISLIEQTDGGNWIVNKSFELNSNKKCI